MEVFDVVVIGAGHAGLSAAKTYLQCAPDTRLLVLESSSSLGGTWSEQRRYDGLRSNNLLGTLEFPSFPLKKEFGVRDDDYVTGKSMSTYLKAYAQVFGVLPCIRYDSRVTRARKCGEGHNEWELDVLSFQADRKETVYKIGCSKLIVASGLTSQPETIEVPMQADFAAPVVHFVDLPKFERMVKSGQHVTVLGGSKASHDTVYELATLGLHVNWVIRTDSYGPVWMIPSYVDVGPFKQCWVEKLATRRFLSWLVPCIWDINKGVSYWMRVLLHKTYLGRKVVDLFWHLLSTDTLSQTGLTRHPALAPLKPDENAMWYGAGISILNYPKDQPIYDLVINGKVSIYRSEIDRFSQGAIHLKNGERLSSEAGLVTNGWKFEPPLTFEPSSLYSEMGIPSREYTDTQKAFWQSQDARAEKHILEALPRLKSAPARPEADRHLPAKSAPLEPYRLYQFAAPPELASKGDRSIVFHGIVANFVTMPNKEIGALWCYAYLNRQLDSLDGPRRDEIDFAYQASLTSKFCALRYPYGYGHRFPDFVFEQIPYLDNLLRDLGLPWRRKNSWWEEIFRSYGPADYRTVTEEWLHLQKKRS